MVQQDWPIPVEVVKFVDEILDGIWHRLTGHRSRLRTAEMGAWFLIGFCTGLRGEEMLMIGYKGAKDSLLF